MEACRAAVSATPTSASTVWSAKCPVYELVWCGPEARFVPLLDLPLDLHPERQAVLDL